MNEEFLLSAIDELDFDINSITGRDRPDIRYLAKYTVLTGYPVSGRIYGIWMDIRYLAEYPVSCRISGICPGIGI